MVTVNSKNLLGRPCRTQRPAHQGVQTKLSSGKIRVVQVKRNQGWTVDAAIQPLSSQLSVKIPTSPVKACVRARYGMVSRVQYGLGARQSYETFRFVPNSSKFSNGPLIRFPLNIILSSLLLPK